MIDVYRATYYAYWEVLEHEAKGETVYQHGRQARRQALAAVFDLVERQQHEGGHRYLSTGCLHGEHDYCASMIGLAGAKRPATCKFCAAHCICECHKK